MAAKRRKIFSVQLPAGEGITVKLRRANKKDKESLIRLYAEIYGADYPLEIIKEPSVLNKCLTSKHFFWPVMVHDGIIVGSVIFEWDDRQGLAKVFGAVIRPDWQGHDLMRKAIIAGLDYLAETGVPIDVIYATTRTVSPAPEKLVRRIGFKTLGIFPNVRKVKDFETHGLNVYFRKGSLDKRLKNPRLVPEIVDLYQIARDVCELSDEPIVAPIELPNPEPRDLVFHLYRKPSVVKKAFNEAFDAGRIKYSFFPFHEPTVLLQSAEGDSEVFINHNTYDNYGTIVGLRTDRQDTTGFLHQTCEAAAQLGIKYIELLVSAFDPVKQRQALDAHFLPCAYFPAMKPVEGGKRMDYLVFSRSYETLDFTDIRLSGDATRFLDVFMKCWYWHMLKDEPSYTDWDALASPDFGQ